MSHPLTAMGVQVTVIGAEMKAKLAAKAEKRHRDDPRHAPVELRWPDATRVMAAGSEELAKSFVQHIREAVAA